MVPLYSIRYMHALHASVRDVTPPNLHLLIMGRSFLPETLRNLVGDGSITPSPIYRPLIPIIGRDRPRVSSTEIPPRRSLSNPFRLFLNLDVVLLLLYTATVYALFYGVLATISSSFNDIYPFLNQTSLGLCFLAIGGGMIIGSAFTGKLLDKDYSRIANQMRGAAEADPEMKILPGDVTKEANFPIEKARLRTVPVYLVIMVACCVGHGWCIDQKVNIAGPLILQIVSSYYLLPTLLVFRANHSLHSVGYTFMAMSNISQTLIVDLMPEHGSSITACVSLSQSSVGAGNDKENHLQNNLVRCSLAAVLVSVIDIITNGLGAGWTYVLLGGVCLLIVGPTVALGMRVGPRCRARRRLGKTNQKPGNP